MEQIALAGGYRTKQSIYNISRGVNTIPVSRQKLMAKNLNVPLDKFKKAYLADIKSMY